MKTTWPVSPAELPDDELIQMILAGEHSLFEQVMRRYNARLYRIGMTIVNNDTDVEDLMQAAYIKAYEHLRDFEQRSAFGTWLTRIMINECLHHVKKNSKVMNVAANEDVPEQGRGTRSADATLMSKELSRVLEHSLAQLPDKYRMVFVLREVENLSVAETTDVLGISGVNVKVRLNRAKAMLRDALTGYYRNDGIYHFHLSRCDRVVNNVLLQLGIIN